MGAGAGNVLGWGVMRRLAWLGGLLALGMIGARAETPVRYDMGFAVQSVPVSGGASFGQRFYFANGNRVAYRVVPAGGSESEPAARWEYWASATGGQAILPVAGDAAVDVRGMNASGEVVGQTIGANATRNAAMFWTLSAGGAVPAGFDAGYSGLEAISVSGRAAGFTYSANVSGEVRVTWNASSPLDAAVAITPPAQTSAPQVVGVSGAGDVLLYVSAAGGTKRAAIWNGTSSRLIGPVPGSGETFYPANSAISGNGHVALLYFTVGGGFRVMVIAPEDRTTWKEFMFAGPTDSVYNLRVSNAGLATCDTAIGGTNVVCVANAARDTQRTLTGYRSFLNDGGEIVYGDGGKVWYWAAAGGAGDPVEVPVSATTTSGGLDLLGFNDEGRLLALLTQGNSRTLAVLAPAFPEPGVVRLRAVRPQVNWALGTSGSRRLVRAEIGGQKPVTNLRYVLRGTPPAGLRFRGRDAVLTGRATAAQSRSVRVQAIYVAEGLTKRSPSVRVQVVVRAQ